jgi:hypothetical protein
MATTADKGQECIDAICGALTPALADAHTATRLVLHRGAIYRMPKRSYLRMLRAVSEGVERPTWEELGAKCLGGIDCDTADLDDAEAILLMVAEKEFCAEDA